MLNFQTHLHSFRAHLKEILSLRVPASGTQLLSRPRTFCHNVCVRRSLPPPHGSALSGSTAATAFSNLGVHCGDSASTDSLHTPRDLNAFLKAANCGTSAASGASLPKPRTSLPSFPRFQLKEEEKKKEEEKAAGGNVQLRIYRSQRTAGPLLGND